MEGQPHPLPETVESQGPAAPAESNTTLPGGADQSEHCIDSV